MNWQIRLPKPETGAAAALIFTNVSCLLAPVIASIRQTHYPVPGYSNRDEIFLLIFLKCQILCVSTELWPYAAMGPSQPHLLWTVLTWIWPWIWPFVLLISTTQDKTKGESGILRAASAVINQVGKWKVRLLCAGFLHEFYVESNLRHPKFNKKCAKIYANFYTKKGKNSENNKLTKSFYILKPKATPRLF